MQSSLSVLTLTALCFALAVPAQEDPELAMPEPAPELKKLEPLIGHWQGGGTARMGPGEPTPWEAHSSYAWALGGFFVQEDTVVRFEGVPNPLVMRTYLGWDPAKGSYVAASVDNDGHVATNRMELPDAATFVTVAERVHEGRLHVERYTTKRSGDTATFSIDVMTASGPPMQLVTGTMKRVEEPAPAALDGGPFMATPRPELTRLARTAGTFDVKASMAMAPGQPEMQITGVDEVRARFGGNVVHVHTTGVAEEHPGQYVGEVFYGYDERRNGVVALFVSNMGEVGEMAATFSADGRQFILTGASPFMGQPCAQRMVMYLDANGAPERAVGHTMVGAEDPLASWKATYTAR